MQTEEYARLFEHEDDYWWYVGRRRLARDLLLSNLDLSKSFEVLDLGCGTGAMLAELDLSNISPTGLDANSLALEFCKRRGMNTLLLGDGSALPIQDKRFDAIIALDIFEHIENDTRAFSEAFRVLTPGGILVLSVPAFQWLWGPHDVSLMHFRRYRASEVRAKLEEAGFEIIKLSYGVFFLFPAVVVVRLLDKLRRGRAKVSLPSVPNWLNRFLIWILNVESRWILQSKLPWGSSVVAVARKKILSDG